MTTERSNKTSITQERLCADLRALGVTAGSHVLMHSSLSRIGYVEGGAATVVQALVDVVGNEGTALFPAHTGHEQISPENPPAFDVRTSATLSIGAIPEAARLHPGAVRSLQPTHSVTAIGNQAAWFTEGHERCDTPCGLGSPYEKLRQIHGKILLLGCGHHSNTTIHMVEELAGVPYHLLAGTGTMRITDYQGVLHLIPGRFHRWGVPRDFMRGDIEMTELGIQRFGHIGLAEARLVDAAGLCDFLIGKLAHDPHFLLPEGYDPALAG